jgi:DNA-binding SARP family transcriptional activator
VRLRILGPLELTVDGRSVDLGGTRQRIVLSMLAMQANRVASIDHLIDAVWDSSPPSTARGQIQICISTLRKLFNAAGHPDAIQTRPPGYLLRIDDLDKEMFESLVSKGHAQVENDQIAEAANTLRSALALWRGPALADIHNELPRRSAIALDDARFSAHMAYLRAQMMLGRHREIIGELRSLISEQPLHEELHGLLMLALYRSGRQADALAAFRTARAVLVEDVGVEPCFELQRLERAILNQDPSLDVPLNGSRAFEVEAPPAEPPIIKPMTLEPIPAEPPMTPQQLPASVGDFTGRESEIAEVLHVLSDGPGSRSVPYAARIVAISGRGGIGKSALAVRVGHELSAAFPDGQLYAELKVPHGDGQTSEVLTRFLHALGVNGSAVPEHPEDRLKLYRSKVANKRLLIVLDDIGNEEQVLPLLPGSPGCAVILTSRTRLSGLGGASWVELDQFSEENAMELLTRIIGAERVQAELADATKLVNLCGGLPLALRIAGARLASRPHWRIRELVRRLSDEARRLDEFVYNSLELRSNIGLTYCVLTQQAQWLFRLAALIQAPDFPAWTAAALLDTDLAEAEEVLESLVDARLLDVVVCPDQQGVHYRFHDLIRVYAVEKSATDSESERREALSRVVGGWLTLADEAHRMQYGGDYTIVHGQTARWWPTDARPADLIGNPMDWWENERRALMAAIRQTASVGWHDACWDLALSSVTLFEAKGYFDDWLAVTQLARESVQRAGNHVGNAAMLYSLGEYHLSQKRLTDAEPYFAEALELFTTAEHEHGIALVLCNWATVDRLRGDVEAMYPKYLKALDTFHRVGDRIGEAYVMCSLAKFWIGEGEYGLAEGLLNDALVICRTEQCRRVEAQVLHRLADVYLTTDKFGLAAQMLDRVLMLVLGLGDRIGEAYAEYSLGVVYFREGSLEKAAGALRRALTLSAQVGQPLVEGQARYTLSEIALAMGDTIAAGSHLGEASRIFDSLSDSLWQAKTRILRSKIHRARSDVVSAENELGRAEALLTNCDSKEADVLLGQLAGLRSADH